MRDTHPKPYVRERASALLQIADGASGSQVARAGLLRPRQPDTIYAWVDRYRSEGLDGLYIRPGRGRKPAFSPSARDGGGSQSGNPDGGAAGAAPVWP